MTTTEEVIINVGRNVTCTAGNREVIVNIASVATANYIASDSNFALNGAGGSTYLKYNSTTHEVELWVLGSIKASWG